MEPKSERRSKGTIWILALVAFVLVGVVAAVLRFRHSGGEPSIRGRTLTEWTERAFFKSAPGSPEDLEARQAIRDIGRDAIPYLLLCIEGKPTAKDKVSDFLRTNGLPKLAGWLGGGSQSAFMRSLNAVFGFEALGTNAVPAVPRLAELIDRSRSSRAPAAMAHLGREGQLQLLARFPDPEKAYPLGASDGAGNINCLLALARQKQFEPEVLACVGRYATNSDNNFRRMALLAIRSLEGNLDIKRSLLDWAFKVGWDFQDPWTLRMLESTPELVEEYRSRIAGLRNLTDPEAIALRNRFLAPTNAVGR